MGRGGRCGEGTVAVGAGVRDDDVAQGGTGGGRCSPHCRSCGGSRCCCLGVDLKGVWCCGGVLLPLDPAVAFSRPHAVLVVLGLQLLAEVVVLDGVGDPSEVLDTVCRGSEGSCSI